MNERTASLFALLIALLILAGGFTIAGIYGGRRIPDLLQVTARGVVPPGFVAILGKQKNYTVWLAIEEDESEIDDIDGTVGHLAYLPPSVDVEIVDLSSGSSIDLVQKSPILRHSGGETTISIGEFQSDRPGQQIQLKASGLNESVTMSVMPTNIGQVLRVSICLIGITVVTIAVSLAVLYQVTRRLGDSTAPVE